MDQQPAIRSRAVDGYQVMEKNDGGDYWELFQRFRRKEIPARAFSNAVSARDVFLLEDGDRSYILKWDHTGWGFGGEGRLEQAFWKLVRGPFYSRLMRRVNRARQAGCERSQDIYLVAEKRTLHYCHDAVILLEYLEGDILTSMDAIEPFLPEMANCLEELHWHDLALCDVAAHNFIRTADGVKALDLVCRGNPRVDRVKDAIRAKRNFGLDLPLRGPVDRLLFHLLSAYQTTRRRWMDYKRSRRALHRDRNFR